MNHTARPLRINVGFLVNQPPGFQREVLVEFDTYKFEDDFEVNDLHGMITLARTQNGVRVLADLAANIPMECGRCGAITQELHSEFEEIFTFAHRPLSEDEAIIRRMAISDFDPIIREYMLLEVHIRQSASLTVRDYARFAGRTSTIAFVSMEKLRKAAGIQARSRAASIKITGEYIGNSNPDPSDSDSILDSLLEKADLQAI